MCVPFLILHVRVGTNNIVQLDYSVSFLKELQITVIRTYSLVFRTFKQFLSEKRSFKGRYGNVRFDFGLYQVHCQSGHYQFHLETPSYYSSSFTMKSQCDSNFLCHNISNNNVLSHISTLQSVVLHTRHTLSYISDTPFSWGDVLTKFERIFNLQKIDSYSLPRVL